MFFSKPAIIETNVSFFENIKWFYVNRESTLVGDRG